MKIEIGDKVKSKNDNWTHNYKGYGYFCTKGLIGIVIELLIEPLYVDPITGESTDILAPNECCVVEFENGIRLCKKCFDFEIIKKGRISKLERILNEN